MDSTRIALKAYYKLTLQISRIFLLKVIRTYSLVIDSSGIDNDVATNSATPAPQTECSIFIDDSSRRQQRENGHKTRARSANCELDTAKAGEAKQNNATQEYTINRVIRHVGTNDNILYVVRWYGNDASDDSIEPLDRIPQHFMPHSCS